MKFEWQLSVHHFMVNLKILELMSPNGEAMTVTDAVQDQLFGLFRIEPWASSEMLGCAATPANSS